jgi:hypothetical protein
MKGTHTNTMKLTQQVLDRITSIEKRLTVFTQPQNVADRKITKAIAEEVVARHFGDKLSQPCSVATCQNWVNAAQTWLGTTHDHTAPIDVVCPVHAASYVVTYKHRVDTRLVEAWLHHHPNAVAMCALCEHPACMVRLGGDSVVCHKIPFANVFNADIGNIHIGSARCKRKLDIAYKTDTLVPTNTPAARGVPATYAKAARKEFMSLCIKKCTDCAVTRMQALVRALQLCEHTTITLALD